MDTAKKHSVSDYEYVIFSYHGLPERQITKSDDIHNGSLCKLGNCCDSINKNNEHCYRANCFETTRQLVKQMNIPEGKYETTLFYKNLQSGEVKGFKSTEKYPWDDTLHWKSDRCLQVF